MNTSRCKLLVLSVGSVAAATLGPLVEERPDTHGAAGDVGVDRHAEIG